MIDRATGDEGRPGLPHPHGGMLLLDKPQGMTSQSAVTRVKRLLGAKKAGHTGTLDPMATGLLPVCIGEATKFSHLLLESEKTYEATVRLGVVTSTGDADGEPISVCPVAVSRTQVADAVARFVGETTQIPPMHSALKHRGERLYKLARKGIVIERSPRAVWIRSIDVLELDSALLRIRVTCGKGTYVRVLAEDIGKALLCGASLAALRRTAVGALRIEDALPLEALEALAPAARTARLLDVDAPVAALPRIDFDYAQSRRLLQGQSVAMEAGAQRALARLYGPGGSFLGVGMCDGSGAVVPQRLVQLRAAANNA